MVDDMVDRVEEVSRTLQRKRSQIPQNLAIIKPAIKTLGYATA